MSFQTFCTVLALLLILLSDLILLSPQGGLLALSSKCLVALTLHYITLQHTIKKCSCTKQHEICCEIRPRVSDTVS